MIASLSALSGGLILLLGLPSLAAADREVKVVAKGDPKPTSQATNTTAKPAKAGPGEDQSASTTKRLLQTDQRRFEVYIRDAENECTNAVNRVTLKKYQLAENNVVLSLLRIDVTRKYMEKHQDRIALLKARFLGREKYWVNFYTTNYMEMRTRTYRIENKLNDLITKLAEEGATNLIHAYRTTGRKEIESGRDPQEVLDQWRKVIGTGDTVVEPPPAPAGAMKPLGSGYSTDGKTVLGPDNKPIPGAVVGADGKVKVGQFTIDPATGTITGPDGEPIPGAKVQDGRIKIGQCTVDPITGKVYGPDGKEIPGAAIKGGKIVLPDGTVIDPDTGKPLAKPAAQINANSTFVTPGGDPVRLEREWFDEQGKLKKYKVEVVYIGEENGQIKSEALLRSNVREESGKIVWDTPTEEPGSRIKWILDIRKVEDKKLGDGFQATFEVTNDGTEPADATFEVTAWEGPDASRRETKERRATFDFPKPGEYSLRVYGQTTKYKDKFRISAQVRF